MKERICTLHKVVMIVVITLFFTACGKKEDSSEELVDNGSSVVEEKSSTQPESMSKEEKLSYSLGYVIGERLKSDFENIKIDMMLKGTKDAVNGNKPLLANDEMQKNIETAHKERMEKMQKKMEAEAKVNLEKSERFLKKNAQEPGIKVTNSGLQYKDITNDLTEEDKDQLLSYLKTKPELKDEVPTDNSMVTVSYVGMYANDQGKYEIFDDSKKRKEPTEFKVNQVIKGWQEALKLMKVGETFDIFIPPELGYGKQGVHGRIPPNTVLRFKVTLLKVTDVEAETGENSADSAVDSIEENNEKAEDKEVGTGEIEKESSSQSSSDDAVDDHDEN